MFEAMRAIAFNFVSYHRLSLNPNTKKYWDAKLSSYEKYWRNENYLSLLDLFPSGKRFSLLDIGCALGDGCELIKSHYPCASITGADISSTAIEKARGKGIEIEYILLDILRDPLPRKFDFITIIQTLEHFDDPFLVVKKCQQSTMKSVFVSVPYKQTCNKAGKEFQAKLVNRTEHRYSFDEDTLSAFNAKVVRITPFQEGTQARCIIYEVPGKG